MKQQTHPSRWFSLKAKLVFAILGTACVSLLLACGLFVFHELKTFRQSLYTRVTILADVLALNSAVALDFDDRERAMEILDGMAAAPSIIAAGLYTKQGELFASYSRRKAPVNMPAAPEADTPRFAQDHLFLYRPVIRDGQTIGTIGLVASSEELHERLVSYGKISGMVLAVCIGLAALLGYFLQRMISKPVTNLAATALLISEGKDYSVRAVAETDDELGQLAASFNHMLAGIHERDSTLVAANRELKHQIDARMQAEKDLKSLNEELERRVENRTGELRRSNKELEQFAYVASHDLQEPLRMIVSYLQLLDRRYRDKLDGEGTQFMQFAVEGGQRMQTLIHDLLAFSRVRASKKPFEPVDLNRLMPTILANLKVALAESGATITQDKLPTVNGDPTHLAQLFQNLIANGIKFRSKQPPRIHITAERGKSEWRCCVQDNGIGIDPQYFERIFVIFQRLHGRDDYPGTGIGLAVCKRIAELHGGHISVESEPGKGSKFCFTIADSVPYEI